MTADAQDRAPERLDTPVGTIRCLTCERHFVAPLPRWQCPYCGGDVSQKMGTIVVDKEAR